MLVNRFSRLAPNIIRPLSVSTVRKEEVDVCVVGGGIIGLATAREINKRHPNLKLTVVEKENELALHQSGSNSGSIQHEYYCVTQIFRRYSCGNILRTGISKS